MTAPHHWTNAWLSSPFSPSKPATWVRPISYTPTGITSSATQQTVAGGGVSVTSDIQTVTLLASVPLTDEEWQPLPKNTILVVSQGEVVARA
jgi:hypothetical protein